MGYKNDDTCILKAYEDERLFVLMARDPQAPEVIIKWIAHSLGNQPDDKIREALECAIEMQNKGDEFRKRVAQAKKEAAEAEERYNFELWKKQREGKVMSPLNQGQAVYNHDEAIQEIASTRDVTFTRNFANWLDSMGTGGKADEAVKNAHGFALLFEEFVKSVPSRR